MSKTRILIHIVFGTKNRRQTIPEEKLESLHSYIYTVLVNSGCFVHRINGRREHIHIILDLNPTLSLSNLIKNIKISGNNWIKNNAYSLGFDGWGKGYFAASVSPSHLAAIKEYIKNQKEHHTKKNYYEEIEQLIKHASLQWYPDDWN